MARGPVREVTAAEAAELIDQGAVLIDTREQHEWNAGHLAGATMVPPIEVLDRIESVAPDKTEQVVVYCAAGARSMRAAMQMAGLGYQNVASMAGGGGDANLFRYVENNPVGLFSYLPTHRQSPEIRVMRATL